MSPPKPLRATESRAIAALEGATFHGFRWLMISYASFLLWRTNVRLWCAVGVLVVRGNVAAKQMARLRTARDGRTIATAVVHAVRMRHWPLRRAGADTRSVFERLISSASLPWLHDSRMPPMATTRLPD